MHSALTTVFRCRSTNIPTTGAVALILAMITGGLAFAGKPSGAGNGGGGKEPPPLPPPILYELTWIDMGPGWSARAYDMNNNGTVVGTAFSASGDVAYKFRDGIVDNLNLLGARWTDLDEPNGSTSGWTATEARKINVLGQIVGTALNKFTLAERAFVLSFPEEAPPEFTLLPSLGLSHTFGAAINDLSVVIATSDAGYIVYAPGTDPQFLLDVPSAGSDRRCDLNNYGEFVNGRGVYFAPIGIYDYSSGVFIQETDHWFYGINDFGAICGSRKSVKGKNGQQGGPIRRGPFPNGTEQLLGAGSVTDFAADINEAGDVCYTYVNRGYLYTDLAGNDGQPLGTLALDSLILFPDAASETEWKSSPCTLWALNDPDETGFGQVCGILGNSGAWRSFVLTPVPVEAP